VFSDTEDCGGHLFLGEQGALTMMPLFLLDQSIDATEVSFWTGIVCQGISIGGSVLGGWLVTNFEYVGHFCCFNGFCAPYSIFFLNMLIISMCFCLFNIFCTLLLQ